MFFFLNTCKRLEIWTVDIDTNCAHPEFYSVGDLSSFRGIKQQELVADHSLLGSTEIMDEWSFASSPSQPLWLDGQYFTSCIGESKMWGEKVCGHFLARTVQCKYSQFKCCYVQDSNSVSGVHKPHNLPLISLSAYGDIWKRGVAIFWLGICNIPSV